MEMFYFLLLLLVGIAQNVAKHSHAPRTKIRQGEIIGTTYKTYSGREVYGFYGLPFAKPPVGDLRFEPPQPPRSWKEPLKATNRSDFCIQPFLAAPVVEIGNEDCLYLDVYTPAVPKDGECEKLYNVLIYLFPSGFLILAGSTIEPYYIMDKHDLVFVPINYRLGTLGFLSTGDLTVPGNNPLKDQNMAMKWVRDNIRSFCGDPNKVTLSGASGGAVSTSLHMLSPQSKGLFHNAITASGYAFTLLNFNAENKNFTRTIANQMNCPTKDTKTMVQCMKHKPANVFFDYTLQFRPFLLTPLATFAPQIEPCHEGAFLTKTPIQVLEDGELYDVPVLSVMNEFEGLVYTFMISLPGVLEILDLTYKNNFKYFLEYYHLTPPHLFEKTSEKIKRKYFKNGLITGNEYGFKKMVTDAFFGQALYNQSLFYSRKMKSPHYNFFSTYRGAISTSQILSVIQSNKNYGASHFDADLYVIFDGISDKKFRRNKHDTEMIELMTELYYSFMVNGKPSIADKVGWKPQRKEGDIFDYLQFDNPRHMRPKANDNFGNRKFWSSLPIDVYRGYPDDTCKPNSRRH